jgi:ferric iron reductase protein FhuF
MKTTELVLKCYIDREEGSWVAVCLDFNLATQAESQHDAKQKLEAMIHSYVSEALTNDREYADQLLTRKAPLSLWARYYFIALMSLLHKDHRSTFSEVMPLRLA